jgi:hypothetical protein
MQAAAIARPWLMSVFFGPCSQRCPGLSSGAPVRPIGPHAGHLKATQRPCAQIMVLVGLVARKRIAEDPGTCRSHLHTAQMHVPVEAWVVATPLDHPCCASRPKVRAVPSCAACMEHPLPSGGVDALMSQQLLHASQLSTGIRSRGCAGAHQLPSFLDDRSGYVSKL